jgi:hypothetical protein
MGWGVMGRRLAVVLAGVAAAALCPALALATGAAAQFAGARAAVTAGGSRGNAEEVLGLAALNVGGDAEVELVSCASPGNCSADRYYGSSLGQEGFLVDYAAPRLDDITTTTLAETGGGGAAGTPVDFTVIVADPSDPADIPAGTVSFYDNGSTTPLGTATLTGGMATFAYTYAAAGPHLVVAAYNPPACSPWQASNSAPVAFTETARASACASCADVQAIEGTIPAGTLAVYSPYTAASPLNLGTLALNANGTYFTASAPLDSNAADVPTAGAIPDTTFNGITVVDTQAGNLPWAVTALASNLGDGGSNPGSTISGHNVGLASLAAVAVPGNALTAGDLVFSNQPAANPPVGPTDTGSAGLGGATAHTIVTDSQQADGTIGINGTVTLNAPTSTEAGLFVGTITLTIAS